MAARGNQHRTVAVDVDAEPAPEPRHWPWPWWLIAGAGPLLVLAGGYLLLAALAAVGWLTSPHADLGSALRLAADVGLLAHGTPVVIAGQSLSLAPLGLTLLLIFLAMPVAGWAARQAAAQAGDPDDTGQLWVDPEAIMIRVGGTFAATYAVAVVAASAALGVASWRAVIGAAVVGGIAGFAGAARGLRYDPTGAWPAWLRAVPRAMGAALLVVLASASALLVGALVAGGQRVTAIVDGLDGGVVGLVLLVALHLLYLPNLVLACASWVLGAGVTVGDGSLVSMAITDVGFLPAIPAFGIVPDPGFGSTLHFAWLAAGAVAGIVAALAVAWARPRARFDETALVGGLSGVAAGLVLVVACALGSGALGSDRLAHVGARVGELAIFAPTLLGLSGMAAGLGLGLIRRPARPVVADPEDDVDTLPDDAPPPISD